jgi:serpin B/serpin B11/12
MSANYKRSNLTDKSRKVPNMNTEAEIDDILPDAIESVNSIGLNLYENIDGASNLFSPLAFSLQIGLIQLAKVKKIIPYVYDKDTLEEFKKILKKVPDCRFNCELSYPSVNQALYDKLVNSMATVVDLNHRYMATTYLLEIKFRDPFYEIDTVKMMFHQTDELDFMHGFGSYMYFSGPKMRVLTMPLIDTDYDFIIILPKAYEQEDNLDYSINDVPYPPIGEIEEYINNAAPTDMEVFIPKFRRDNDLDLTIAAEKIDLRMGFNINHNTTLIVSDETSSLRKSSDLKEKIKQPSITFKANHVFVYIIRHNKSGIFVIYGDFQG